MIKAVADAAWLWTIGMALDDAVDRELYAPAEAVQLVRRGIGGWQPGCPHARDRPVEIVDANL